MSELRLGGGTYPALGINVPQPGAGSSPLGAMGQFAEIQNRLNQNVLFQQTFHARLQAGEIIAGSPDMETAMQRLYQNPQVAPFAGQIANEYRQYQLTTTQMGGQLQTQAHDAMSMVMKNLPSLYNAPENWSAIVANAKAVTNPQVWPRVQQSMESMREALVGPNANGAAPSADDFHRRLAGMMLPHMTADQFASVVGQPSMQDFGGYKQPFLSIPGKGMFPASGPISTTMPPQYHGDIPTQSGAPMPGVVSQTPGGGASIQPFQAPGGLGGGGGPPVGGLVPGGALAAPQAPNSQLPGPGAGLAAGSSNAPAGGILLGQTPAQTDYSKGLAKAATDRQNEVADLITNGNVTMQTISQMREAMQHFTPGMLAPLKTDIARFLIGLGAKEEDVNSIMNVGSAQEFNKLAVNTLSSNIRQAIQGIGGSRINMLEWDTFKKANPDLETNPNAIDKIFNFWTRMHQINLAQQPELAQYLNSGGNPATWESEWSNRLAQRGWLNIGRPTFSPAGASPMGAASAPQAPSSTSKKPTHTYNPATGGYDPLPQ